MNLLKPLLITAALATFSQHLSAVPLAVEQQPISQTVSSAININAADVDLLSSLPGIGIGKAKAIINYREQNGAFTSVDDLKKVKGIGDKLLLKLRTKIKVN